MDAPGSGTDQPVSSWAERAAARSPAVERARVRSALRAQQILEAAFRLIAVKGSDFTAVELAKEAGIAIQTFYKHFGSKDQVLLAVLEQLISTTCTRLLEAGRQLPDPIARLRSYVMGLVLHIGPEGMSTPVARFVATEHWRLQQTHPVELAAIIRPFTDLLQHELQAAEAGGLLAPTGVGDDAWLTTQLVVAVFHHYAFSTSEKSATEIAEGLWAFCLGAWGGRPAETSRRDVRRSTTKEKIHATRAT